MQIATPVTRVYNFQSLSDKISFNSWTEIWRLNCVYILVVTTIDILTVYKHIKSDYNAHIEPITTIDSFCWGEMDYYL